MSKLVDKNLEELKRYIEDEKIPVEIKSLFIEAQTHYLEAKKIRKNTEKEIVREKYVKALDEAKHALSAFKSKTKYRITSEFLSFFIPLVKETNEKIERYLYKAKVMDISSLRQSIKTIQDILTKLIPTSGLEDLIKTHNMLRSRILTTDKEYSIMKDKKKHELEKTMIALLKDESVAVNLVHAKNALNEIPVEEEDSKEEAPYEDVTTEAEILQIEKFFEERREAVEYDYNIFMSSLESQKYEQTAAAEQNIEHLRQTRATDLLDYLIHNNDELSVAMSDLYQKFQEFPGVVHEHSRRPLTSEEIKFMEDLSGKKVIPEEKYKLVERKKTTEELLSLIMPAIHDKNELKKVLDTLVDSKTAAKLTVQILDQVKKAVGKSDIGKREAAIRYYISTALEAYKLAPKPVSIKERTQQVISQPRLRGKERIFQQQREREDEELPLREEAGVDLGDDINGDRAIEEEDVYAREEVEQEIEDEDLEEERYRKEREQELDEEEKDAEDYDQIEEVESDLEEEVLDSEDEEEPEILIEDKDSVKKDQFIPFPLSVGEKLLLDLPMLQMSESRYKQIVTEIQTLREEIDSVYLLYDKLEKNVVKPFLKNIEPLINESLLFSILVNTMKEDFGFAIGKRFDVEGEWLSAFDLNDEQRFILKRVEYDQKFAKAFAEHMGDDPVMNLFSDDKLTVVKDLIDGEKWLDHSYPRYLEYIPRIIGKLLYEARLMKEKNILALASPEQALLIKRYSSTNPNPFDSEEVNREVERFKAMTTEDKLKYGVSVIASDPMYSYLAEVRNRLVKLARTDLESKVDYPFVELFQRVARFVPNILLNVLTHHRTQIKETRSTFMLKFLLSRLSPEQYVYVKVYMGNPETKEEFTMIMKNMKKVHFLSSKVEEKGYAELEKIKDEMLKSMVAEVLDHSLSGKIYSIFKTDKPMVEYEKEMRAIIKAEYGLQKTEYNFLKNCRYQFRRRFQLPVPVIGSVDDMKAIEYALEKSLVKGDDGYYRRVNLKEVKSFLDEANKDFSDVNSAYQLDLALLIASIKLRNLIDKKLDKIKEKINPKNPGEALGMLVDLNKRLGEMIKYRKDNFQEVDEFYRRELSIVVKKLHEADPALQIPVEVAAYLIKLDGPQPIRALQQISKNMAKKLKESLRKRGPAVVYDKNRQDLDSGKLALSKIDEIKAIPVEQLSPSDKYTKYIYETYYSKIYEYIVYLINQDEFREEPIEKYEQMYITMLKETLPHFKKEYVSVKMTGIYPDVDAIKVLLNKVYNSEKPTVSTELTKRAYAMISDSRLSYKWEDKGVLHLHPELMRIMPNYVIKTENTPLSFLRNPVFVDKEESEEVSLRVMKEELKKKKTEIKTPEKILTKWSHPSVLFYHTLLNSLSSVAESDEVSMLEMNQVMYELGVVTQSGNIRPATHEEYDQLLEASNVSRVSSILKSELMVIPSNPRPDMVFDVGNSSLFYYGYANDLISDEKYEVEDHGLRQISLLEKTKKEVLELTRVKEIQKERFGQDLALQRAVLREKLLVSGWKRASVRLLREANRSGVVSGNQLRVDGTDFQCAFIVRGELQVASAETVLSFIKSYYEEISRSAVRNIKFLADEPTEDLFIIEEEEEFSGKKNLECANCKKEVKGKGWGNTVEFIEGKAKVVPLCSEKCSEKYHPTK